MPDKELKDWAHNNSNFFKLENGQSVQATYKGYSIVPNSFDPNKEQPQYKILVGGVMKYWNSSSTKVAESFAKFDVGDLIKITKEATKDGKGRYFVELVSATEETIPPINMSDLDGDVA